MDKIREENEFLIHHRCYFILIFSGLWLIYCWWISEEFYFNFGELTNIFRWIFCLIHVLTIWRFFQYMIKVIWRFYRRLEIIFIDYSLLIILTFVLFVLLTFVLNLRQFLRDICVLND